MRSLPSAHNARHIPVSLNEGVLQLAPPKGNPKPNLLASGDYSRATTAGIGLPHFEPPATSDEQAPVRARHRYLSAPGDQLKYREALVEGLPIGSGEIESAHRYVAQKRLKLPETWWLVEHAEHMLTLRINRLNGDWQDYWADLAANPPAPANRNRPNVSRNLTA